MTAKTLYRADAKIHAGLILWLRMKAALIKEEDFKGAMLAAGWDKRMIDKNTDVEWAKIFRSHIE